MSIVSSNKLTNKEILVLEKSLNRKNSSSGLGKLPLNIIKKALITYPFAEKDSWLLALVSSDLLPLLFKNKKIKPSLILKVALEGYHTDTIKKIIKNNLDYSEVISVLEWASEEGELEVIKSLLENYDFNMLRDGKEAIELAVLYKPESLTLLLKKLDQVEVNRYLDEAVSTCDIPVISIILEDLRSDLSLRKYELLFIAYRRKQFQVLDLLVEHKSVILSEKSDLKVLDLIIKFLLETRK